MIVNRRRKSSTSDIDFCKFNTYSEQGNSKILFSFKTYRSKTGFIVGKSLKTFASVCAFFYLLITPFASGEKYTRFLRASLKSPNGFMNRFTTRKTSVNLENLLFAQSDTLLEQYFFKKRNKKV